MKKLLCLLCAVLLMLSVTACTGNNEDSDEDATVSYDWKFALDEAQGSNQDVYAQIFKELVEEKSDGRIKLDIYFLGQLGDGSNQGELIQNGAIDLGFMAAGAAGSMVPESNIFSMHYIFPSDLQKAKQFLIESKTINETISAAYESKNMHVIDWMDEGFMQWTTSTNPITASDGFKGVKMRVMSAPIITATYKAYGANPVAIPFSELYSALSLNMADGQTNPVEIIEQMKFYEVQNYLTISNSDLYVASLIFNKDLWDSLPEDIKGILLEAVEETRPLYAIEQEKMSDSAIDILKENGMEVNELSKEVTDEFRELAKKAVDEFYKVGGDNAEQVYESFIEEVKNYY